MCYYSFVRYDCGCAPLDPVRVPTTEYCPNRCRGEPQMYLDSTKHLKYKCSSCQHTAKPGVPGLTWQQQAARYNIPATQMPQYADYARPAILANKARREEEEKARRAAANPEDWTKTEDGKWRKLQASEKGDFALQRRRDYAREHKREIRQEEYARRAIENPDAWTKREDGSYKKKTAAERREDEEVRERERDRRARRAEEEEEARRARGYFRRW